MSIKVLVSQVPKYQSGVLLSSDSVAGRVRQTYVVTGSFDPTKLFRSADDLGALAKYSVAHPVLGMQMDEVGTCNLGTAIASPILENKNTFQTLVDGPQSKIEVNNNCIALLEKGSRLQRVALSLLPKLDVTASSPFDLVKSGNTYIPLPNEGKSLYTVTLTWDAQKMIPSAAERASAIQTWKDRSKPAASSVSAGCLAEQREKTIASYKLEVETLVGKMLFDPRRIDGVGFRLVWASSMGSTLFRIMRAMRVSIVVAVRFGILAPLHIRALSPEVNLKDCVYEHSGGGKGVCGQDWAD